MSESASEFVCGNNGFLDLALQFGFTVEEEVASDCGADDQLILGEILVDISRLQEDIRQLKLKEHKHSLNQKYGRLTEPDSLFQLTSSLRDLGCHLSYIADNSSKLQHKLTNPVISDSLPLATKDQLPLITLTDTLTEVVKNANNLSTSAEWVSNQDWEKSADGLENRTDQVEKLAAKLRSLAFKIQTFREKLGSTK